MEKVFVAQQVARKLFATPYLPSDMLCCAPRFFSSVSSIVATKYEVLVEHKHAAQARELAVGAVGARELLDPRGHRRERRYPVLYMHDGQNLFRDDEAFVAGEGADDARAARIFREGDAAAGIPPCAGCHGVDARGHPLADSDPRYRLYPPLRGQHAAYVAQRLKDYRDDENLITSNDRIMHGVAQRLGDDDAQALAAWLQAMKR